MAGLRDRFAVMFATGLLASCGGDAREEAFALYDQPPPREWRSEERRAGKECRARWSPEH